MTSTSVEETLLQKPINESRIEEVADGSSSSSASDLEGSSDNDECDHDHSHPHTESGEQQPTIRIANRAEKKARKALSKVGLKPMPQVKRVTLRRGKAIFAIDLPEVFKTTDTIDDGENTLIVFGDLQPQNSDMTRMLMDQFASRQDVVNSGYDEIATQMMAEIGNGQSQSTSQTKESITEVEEIEEENAVKNKEGPQEPLPEGVDEKDISIVMSQAGVSRQRAISELVKQKGDIVNAIMELTM